MKKCGASDCRIMMILVNKRVNQRLFATDDNGRVSNPIPGTIVDSGIVDKDTFDFFLVS